jgi:hypothetical protein
VHRTIKVKNIVRRTRHIYENSDKTRTKHGEDRGFKQRLLNLLATPAPYPDSRTCSAFRK